MLVLPVTGGGIKKFPLATFLIILTNCVIFFGFQSSEPAGYNRAFSFYHSSGLAQIEYAAYADYIESKGEGKPADHFTDDPEWVVRTFRIMLEDRVFQKQLMERKVITSDAKFKEWQEKRQEFDEKLGDIFSLRYGYSPLKKNYIATFTCMFLHGSVMHLVGNMVFLWFVGSLLEVGVGWRRFVPGYLVTGVCASLLFGIAYPSEMGPLVGASGAIAGLMGAYGLIFGRVQIKIFYSLGFYFDYAKVPGWALFPFWLANEFIQLYGNTGSNVAYMAHVGGLLSGAAFGLAQKRFSGEHASDMLKKEEQQDRVPLLLEEGLNYFSELKLKESRAKIVEALQIAPDNRKAIMYLFKIDKCSPESEEFHRTAGQLLGLLARGGQADEELCSFFEEYRRVSSKPRLKPDVTAAMVHVYCKMGRLPDASRLLSVLLKQLPNHGKVPGCLWNLGKAYHDGGNRDECKKCLLLLANQYGETVAGQRAADMLVMDKIVYPMAPR